MCGMVGGRDVRGLEMIGRLPALLPSAGECGVQEGDESWSGSQGLVLDF